MKEFIERINKAHSISENSWNELQKLLEIKTYPPNYKLDEIGQVSNNAYILLKGVVRSYYTSQKGKEVNSKIYTDNDYFGEFTSLIRRTPSLAQIETLTECNVLKCNYIDFIKLTDTHADLNRMHRKNLEDFLYATTTARSGLGKLECYKKVFETN